jgi:hypothetical protein
MTPLLTRRTGLLTGGALLVTSATAIAVLSLTEPESSEGSDRQAEVAARGAEVMPFDLEATTHQFTATPTGGRQTVIADHAGDDAEIAAIRQHLQEEATAFEAGDFFDPASIHGEDMPGLATLEANSDAMDIRYLELPDGAAVDFTTTDAQVADALHVWFDAQVSDHGTHAEHQG